MARSMKCSQSCRLFTGLTLTAVVGAAACILLTSASADAREALGRSWPAVQQVSMDRIDHSPLDALLRKYVDKDGFVDYRGLKSSQADRSALQAYLASLSRASTAAPSSKAARLAFWVNAYNAVTLEGILREYPTDSIRNHTKKIGGYNIWKDLPLHVGDGEYSLDTIEHRILRPMGEPRIHFAIVCASVGCPRLRNEAYTAEKVEQQLADNAEDFFTRPGNLRVDSGRGTLWLSSILDWFGDDFGSNQREQLTALAPYLPADARRLISTGRVMVQYLEYDWSLNDQIRKSRAASRQ